MTSIQSFDFFLALQYRYQQNTSHFPGTFPDLGCFSFQERPLQIPECDSEGPDLDGSDLERAPISYGRVS
jgi:hypothetical protein